MKFFLRFGTGFSLAAIALFAESGPYTYTGDIVNANCFQAAKIVSRNSRGYSPAGRINAFVSSGDNALNTAASRKSLLEHCKVNPGTTQFALVGEDGNFLKLNEAGNQQILAKTDSADKKIKVTITGSVEREVLLVKTLSTR